MTRCVPADDRVAVIGAGRIGAATAVGLAHIGWRVDAVDCRPERVEALASGSMAEPEPRLQDVLRSVLTNGRLAILHRPRTAAYKVVLLCVDTPALPSGEADLRQVIAAAQESVDAVGEGGVIVTRSTVPPGTGDRLLYELRSLGRSDIEVVHLPEFLREGHAWEDFTCADRIVIGGESCAAIERVKRLFVLLGRPLIVTDRRTAELAKYANNAFLATSITLANEISDVASVVGADIAQVVEILRADRRIGPRAYLTPGLGFGGHCLPKDTAALEYLARQHGLDLTQLKATLQINERRPFEAAAWLERALCGLCNRTICLAGLAFKPGSEDLRESPMLRLARILAAEGAEVAAWDAGVHQPPSGVRMGLDIEDALLNSDALVIGQSGCEWRELEPQAVRSLMRRAVVYDAVGVLDAGRWAAAGFISNRTADRITVPAGG
jgi:UDPglucose 6-dehydrogenase